MRTTIRYRLAGAGALALVLALSGCATIINGTSQSVDFRSDPPGARVYVDGVARGETPFEADVKRKQEHEVRFELEGYESYDVQLDRTVSPWLAGNILIGGLIGLGIDALSGGMYQVSPSSVGVILEPLPGMGGDR